MPYWNVKWVHFVLCTSLLPTAARDSPAAGVEVFQVIVLCCVEHELERGQRHNKLFGCYSALPAFNTSQVVPPCLCHVSRETGQRFFGGRCVVPLV